MTNYWWLGLRCGHRWGSSRYSPRPPSCDPRWSVPVALAPYNLCFWRSSWIALPILWLH